MIISICQFYENGNLIGESPIPPYSEKDIRRAIAKHMGIVKYDSATITDYELGKKISEGITVNFLANQPESVKSEADPIVYDLIEAATHKTPGMTSGGDAVLLTPTEKIRANYTQQQETGQPPITRPISVGETMVMPTPENPHPEIPKTKEPPKDV